jgi:ferredoxin
MEVQACIPAALCALHNFIHRSDPAVFDIDDDYEVFGGDGGDVGELAEGPADRAEQQRAEQRREVITAEMWEDYCTEHVCHGLPVPGQQ